MSIAVGGTGMEKGDRKNHTSVKLRSNEGGRVSKQMKESGSERWNVSKMAER